MSRLWPSSGRPAASSASSCPLPSPLFRKTLCSVNLCSRAKAPGRELKLWQPRSARVYSKAGCFGFFIPPISPRWPPFRAGGVPVSKCASFSSNLITWCHLIYRLALPWGFTIQVWMKISLLPSSINHWGLAILGRAKPASISIPYFFKHLKSNRNTPIAYLYTHGLVFSVRLKPARFEERGFFQV